MPGFCRPVPQALRKTSGPGSWAERTTLAPTPAAKRTPTSSATSSPATRISRRRQEHLGVLARLTVAGEMEEVPAEAARPLKMRASAASFQTSLVDAGPVEETAEPVAAPLPQPVFDLPVVAQLGEQLGGDAVTE